MPIPPTGDKIDPRAARRFQLAITIGAICFVVILIGGLLLTGGRQGTPTMATSPANETQPAPAQPTR